MMKKKRLVIDQTACLGCGTCVALSPEVFELGGDGKAKVKEITTTDQRLMTNIDEAIEGCPVDAISWQ
jgi:ferredoxin